jgi:hypothetical protein
MAIIDALSKQLLASMTAFGEHNQPADPIEDPEGNPLPHRHNRPKEMHRAHLDPYQAEMADEEGLREFNTMQKFKGVV